jgi:UDP-2-acetamido-2-deoxy-ribo-hexuluronate aminotransferase
MAPEPMAFTDLRRQYQALRDSINGRIQRVLDHGQYIMGPEVVELEGELARFTGAKHCISVSSGTEALLISLMALGLRPGDEVITTPFTFAATVETIVLLGGVPVFVDIDPATCNIDASLLEGRITARTRAIVPVSLYGQVADMDEINDVAARFGIAVVEDAAQSLGASYKGRKSCNLSTLACTSFFPSKPLGCYGDGGAIFTSDDSLAGACREIRVHGQSARYLHTRVGVGGRMDTLQCAVLLGKLERFEWELGRRQEVGRHYVELVASEGIPATPIVVKPDRTSVFAQFTVRIANRAQVQDRLKALGIPTAIHYPIPMHRQPAFAHFCCPDCCANSLEAANSVLSLPMSADISQIEMQRVIDGLQVACT